MIKINAHSVAVVIYMGKYTVHWENPKPILRDHIDYLTFSILYACLNSALNRVRQNIDIQCYQQYY